MNEQLQAMLQQQLRDVHLPDAVSWWPLGIGWWLLIIIVLVITTFLVLKYLKSIKANRYRQSALSEMEQHFQQWQNDLDSSRYLHAANAILRRSIRHISTNEGISKTISGQTGDDWSNELNSYTKNTDKALQASTLQALTIDCYQANPTVDIDKIHVDLKAWLQSHRRPKHA